MFTTVHARCPRAAAGLHITAFFFFFFTEEQGGGGGGSWESRLLASDHRVRSQETSEQNRACQAAQYLPCNMKPYCSIHAFSALRVELTSTKKKDFSHLVTSDENKFDEFLYFVRNIYRIPKIPQLKYRIKI